MINLTEIIVLLLGVVVSVCAGMITYQLVPWLKDKKLYEAALVAVEAAESLYGRYQGRDKFKYALDALKDKGYNIDSSRVVDAVEAAWKSLDSAMRASGEKENDEHDEEEETEE